MKNSPKSSRKQSSKIFRSGLTGDELAQYLDEMKAIAELEGYEALSATDAFIIQVWADYQKASAPSSVPSEDRQLAYSLIREFKALISKYRDVRSRRPLELYEIQDLRDSANDMALLCPDTLKSQLQDRLHDLRKQALELL